ncbi:unnamed protein product [Priceomyces carsonii]|nr:unnamed protein product [Priceomyces carsonii]
MNWLIISVKKKRLNLFVKRVIFMQGQC